MRESCSNSKPLFRAFFSRRKYKKIKKTIAEVILKSTQGCYKALVGKCYSDMNCVMKLRTVTSLYKHYLEQ